MKYPPDYHAAIKLQRQILATLETCNGAIKASDLASLIGAWDKLAERKRILAMRPAPAPIDMLKMRELKEMQKRLTQGVDFAKPVDAGVVEV